MRQRSGQPHRLSPLPPLPPPLLPPLPLPPAEGPLCPSEPVGPSFWYSSSRNRFASMRPVPCTSSLQWSRLQQARGMGSGQVESWSCWSWSACSPCSLARTQQTADQGQRGRWQPDLNTTMTTISSSSSLVPPPDQLVLKHHALHDIRGTLHFNQVAVVRALRHRVRQQVGWWQCQQQQPGHHSALLQGASAGCEKQQVQLGRRTTTAQPCLLHGTAQLKSASAALRSLPATLSPAHRTALVGLEAALCHPQTGSPAAGHECPGSAVAERCPGSQSCPAAWPCAAAPRRRRARCRAAAGSRPRRRCRRCCCRRGRSAAVEAWE